MGLIAVERRQNEYDLDVSKIQCEGQEPRVGSTDLDHVNEVSLLRRLLRFPLLLKLRGSHLVPVKFDVI